MKRLALMFGCLCCYVGTPAQNPESLLKQARSVESQNPDSALQLTEQAINACANDTLCHLEAAYTKGIMLGKQGQYALVLQLANDMLDICHETPENTIRFAIKAHFLKTRSLKSTSQFEDAHTVYHKLSDLLDEYYNEPRAAKAKVLTEQAMLYKQQAHYHKAETYAKRALDLNRQLGKAGEANLHVNYMVLGNIKARLHQHGAALEYYRKSYEKVLEHFPTNRPLQAVALNNMGNMQRRDKQYAASTKSYTKALNIILETYDSAHPYVAKIQTNIGANFQNRMPVPKGHPSVF